MITPRVTRLLRTPGLRAFQRAIALAAGGDDLDRLRDTLVIVSTSGAVDQVRRSLEELWLVERWQPSTDELEAITPAAVERSPAVRATDARDETAAGDAQRHGGGAVDRATRQVALGGDATRVVEGTVGRGGERSEESQSDRSIARVASAPAAMPTPDARVWPQIVTRGGLYRAFYDRLNDPPALLDDYAREVLFQRAAADAVTSGDAPPFEVRPGLIPQMLSLYDALRRQHRRIDDFERLVGGALEVGAEIDRGARRLLQQTRFLVSAFRAYETQLAEDGAFDEHGLRARLLEEASTRPIRRVIVTVPDQRADGTGLWPADFDLLTRIAGLESIDLIATESVLATGYLERLFETLPGIDIRVVPDVEAPSPMLLAPAADGRHDPLHFTSRDREQELADIARRLTAAALSSRDAASSNEAAPSPSQLPSPSPTYDRMAVVYQRPLPYLYLARQVFGAHELPWQAFDALPLAAEPYAAALDLVVTFALSDYTRAAGIALLRAPQFRFEVDGHEPTLAEIAACDAELRDIQFLGGRERLHALLDEWRTEGMPSVRKGERRGRPRTHAVRALAALVAAADALAPLDADALPSDHLDTLQHFLDVFERRSHDRSYQRDVQSGPAAGAGANDNGGAARLAANALANWSADSAASASREAAEQLAARHLRARAAVIGTIRGLRIAFATHGERVGPFRDLAALVHRWLEGQTFNPRIGERGLHLVDVQAAIYGRFSHVAIAGVVEGEWPASSSRSIFYPSSLLRDLGWPAESERRAAARAVFDDLLRLARDEVSVSVFALEHDAIVRPSPFVEDLAGAGLRSRRIVNAPDTEASETSESPESPESPGQSSPVNPHAPAHAHEELMTVPAVTIDTSEPASWAVVRQARTAIADRGFHGWTGAMEPRAYSVTALDRYLQCPFKYFAASVLRLEEEPERRPGLTPLERGRFEHEVFQLFFERWDAAGRGAIDEAALETARAEFVAVVDEVIARLPPSERALERTRLLGSAVGSGLGERVFRFEAARTAPITERLLEYQLDGEYQLPVPASGAEAAAGAEAGARAEAASEAEAVSGAARTRAVRLRATADRIDLLADGTMRVIDYKTGKASTAASSIQLPVYKLCAEERLDMHRGRRWRVSEAGYLAFGRPEPFVPVVSPGDEAQKKVTAAIARVVEVVDRIESGAFPVTPAEPHMCIFCGYAAVCRKDYVDDV